MGRIHFDRPRPSKAIGAALSVLLGLVSLHALWQPAPEPRTLEAAQPSNSPWLRSPFAAGPVPAAAVALQHAEHEWHALFETKSAFVDRLTATGSALDAYVAYATLRDCRLTRAMEAAGRATPQPSAQLCGDLSPGQLVGSVQLLERAARAGVRGALWDFVAEGPDGSRRLPVGTRDQLADPVTGDYFRKIHVFQEAAATGGDRSAMMAASTYAENEEHDPAKALAYWAAQGKLAELQGGTPSASQDGIHARLAATMSPEQAAAAIRQGEAMAAAAASAASVPAVEPIFAQASVAFLEQVKDQAPMAAPAQGPGSPTARSWQPNDSFAVCFEGVCQRARYQASGVWLPERSAAPKQ